VSLATAPRRARRLIPVKATMLIGVLLHTWSLSVEEQFYIALPLGVLLALALAKLLRVHIGRTLLFTASGAAVRGDGHPRRRQHPGRRLLVHHLPLSGPR
jgi:peptidoglycan/LPS O-acetylase OafA/YrhL